MKKLIFISLILFSCNKPQVEKANICSDCGETNCIYQEINLNVKGEGTDSDIQKSIYEVIDKRGITDSCTIELIMANYYL